MTRRGVGASAHPPEGTGLHDDIKGQEDDNDFYGVVFLRVGLAREPNQGSEIAAEFLIY